MSLLKLTPESERLRRIAKAHAAGEISRDEFRRIRTGVIEGFPAQRREEPGDLTQRRWSVTEVTTQPFLPMTAASVADTPKRAPGTVVYGVALLVILLGAALVGAL